MTSEDLNRQFIPIIKRGEIGKVYICNILYIQSEARKIHIHTVEKTQSVYGKIDDVEPMLPENFYRCHKSCIINLDKVENMKDGYIEFENGDKISICREKFVKAFQKYRGYLISHEDAKSISGSGVKNNAKNVP